ncbi:tRNA pseudouridine(55) synthase TruB [Fuchsiella alkaliacetigena]|uniref:tRNA pseudouridine(55) synthase TruB n=1 Tax=Fuchsiella alkaliacetigena TaxID=957042 RepID=UPI00200A3BED|nr:tRNA pseudouridine(55) synthase TruB [Fuchsiella alkaliacetigena]MCK8823501.1 tRNA pseudouridine(55) synthase TruB [Fuchsiella alkaliacetigena]
MQGIINLVKPLNLTSFQAVKRVRKILQIRKVGHTGTLDPLATGVLPICVGRATKVSRFLVDTSKEYIAELRLGIKTDTLDAAGEIVAEEEVSELNTELIKEACAEFVGEIEQVPPMYSAVKQDGKRLYRLAQQGKTVEREPRQVKIYNLKVLAVDLPVIRFAVECSKGTYIRVLAADIAKKLGSCGHLSFLIRDRVGPFKINEAIILAELEKAASTDSLAETLLPIDSALVHYPKIKIKSEPQLYKLVSNGASFDFEGVANQENKLDLGQKIRVYSAEDEFLGIYEFVLEQKSKKRIFKPVRLFC